MNAYRFDVIIIGAGPAGVAAAGALAGTGVSVALLEAGVYAGAENWSGCVYFTESLSAGDCFGPDAVAAAPFERRVTRRGTLLHNGLDVVGIELSDARVFQNCYTVLRPLYDPYFADLARLKGAVHVPGTTVTSLIRSGGRVIGVMTDRGPLHADVTFLAEGDASHLVRSEQLERVQQPHFLQGLKAVLRVDPREIEKRFRLAPGEGAAYELLMRNPAIAGRTAKLNIGGFLYTNRDSISIGYVAPLDNIRDNFRGSHDAIYEWMLGLPYIRELTQGAALSAYGTKIIRSGGWHERPLLVQDGLAVGGASAGMGIDIPFPNFTGPASATGLYFARAVRNILKRGASFDAKHLANEYEKPLRESSYGKNAEYLSRWPGYFGRSKVLFSRTVDVACGTTHFLSEHSLINAGRFLRSHILSFKGIRELLTDTMRAADSLGLWKPVATTLVHPATIWRWMTNLFLKMPQPDQRLGLILHINDRSVDSAALPWPINSLLKKLSPALLLALEQVYANDGRPLRAKFRDALRHLLRGFSLLDFLVLPAYGALLFAVSLGTAVVDAFRFYVLKTPVETLLAEPVMAYGEKQKRARDLDRVKPSISLEAKLATNTYRVGAESHIRTLWPGSITAHPDMSRAGIWWLCPARVYGYDAPPFTGRGRVSVNYENCIKCESCWRAEPERALWGRHTGHKLIYRPDSAVLPVLLERLARNATRPPQNAGTGRLATIDERLWYLNDRILDSSRAVLAALSAFRNSVGKIPHSADRTRTSWPLSLGTRLVQTLSRLETEFTNDRRNEQARIILEERKTLELRLAEAGFFRALYCCGRIEEWILEWTADRERPSPKKGDDPGGLSLSHQEVSALFPDRVVKQWEESPMPEVWCEKLRTFITEHLDASLDAVRVLASINPALGLTAAYQSRAAHILKKAGRAAEPGACAVPGDGLLIEEKNGAVAITGRLAWVPAASLRTLLVLARGKGYLVPVSEAGVTITPTPAIGFRAAGLSEVALACMVQKQAMIDTTADAADSTSYLAVALGAADYLAMRVKEHAAGRVQFPGQMLDTEGRDGIAKLGAVKALIARVEAWRLLLEHLYVLALHSELRTPHSALNLVSAALAAKAFGPEPGTLGYDAGQVFGGFAYSEDDLLSRSYRDSALFRFLAPGYGAAARLHKVLDLDAFDDAIRAAGDLAGVGSEPLGSLASRLLAVTDRSKKLSPDADAALAGEVKALLIGTRSLLVSIEQGLNKGQSSEAGAAAVDVLLGIAEDAVMNAALSAGRGTVAPSAVFPMEPSEFQPATGSDYETFCSRPGEPHQSGSFLATPFDRSPRFVPEMQLADAGLRARWAELVDWFRKNCSEKRFDELGIERFIERNHRLPQEIIEAAKQQRWLATYIPRSLDGLGWRKAEYYILNSAAGSFGDASVDLLIMASTSIGTTPILLGLEEELPRVREELTPLVQDERKLGEIGDRLAAIIRTLNNPDPGRIRKEYEAVMKRVDDRLRHTRVAKYLAANFLKAFYGAGIAGRRGDFGGFIASLKQAGDLFAKLMPDVRAALNELPRRERCHKLFLRYLGHGAVSAFALTEPTAGSDSGGVKTTGKLLSAPLTPLEDGRYSFTVHADDQGMRYLIDADRIVFTEGGIAYETPDGQPQPIRYDRYDYTTDQGSRYYNYQGMDCLFHDIGQVRRNDAGLFYEHYSLTGAKMWITNGSIATQFCLYAQTPEGVTGFMVDRHGEGLKVGADEKKTGQRGSPTNEISLDSLRVPREAVIGYEGHGQVNALETLNVGRCGLAVVSGALMRKLMNEANTLLPASPERDRLLGEAAAVLFASESLAYYLVGLFDRPHESVRMESAIAKYACSEDIHELITLLDEAFGPESQTEKYLIEKARRDSRILTIYEGTNEVQRFLILKDLIAMAANWPEAAEQGSEPEAVLASWKNRLRKQVREVADLLSDTSWSDAMLQPALFPLSDLAGEILRLECIEYRTEWLRTHQQQLEQSLPGYAGKMLSAGQRASARTRMRLEHLEEKFVYAWEQVKKGMHLPEVVLADAALDALQEKGEAAAPARGALMVPLRVLSIIRPVADLASRPRITDGQLNELVWKIDPADLAALSQALRMKATSSGQVTVDVLMPGGPEQEMLLTMTAGSRADALFRLDGQPSAGVTLYAQAIMSRERGQQYDIITTGAACLNGDRALGAYLAGRLGRSHEQRETIGIRPDGTGPVGIALPAVISISGSAPPPVLLMHECVLAARSTAAVLTAGEKDTSQERFELPAAEQKTSPLCTDPVTAATFIKRFAASINAGAVQDYTAALSPGSMPEGNAVWAMLEAHEGTANSAVLRTCALAAGIRQAKACALIPAPRGLWPQLLGLARINGCEQAFCLDTREGSLSGDGRNEILRRVLKISSSMMIFGGTRWTGPFAYAAGEAAAQKRKVLVCSGVTAITKGSSGGLLFSFPVYEGKLLGLQNFESGSACVTIAPEGEFPAPAEKTDFRAAVLDLAVDPGWLMPLPAAAPPTLSEADVIIDLGYGIRDSAGFKLAQELKGKLESLGLAPLFGATRKVTQDLKLLPLAAQIGQTGVRVNPKMIIALGISGAPQHIDYLGTRAEILCFNKDTEAPLMKLNQGRPAPRVHPIPGDLFVTVRQVLQLLE